MAYLTTSRHPSFADPMAIIFLDVDWVIMGDRFAPPLNGLIRSTLNERFVKGSDGNFTPLQHRIAASHYFEETAVENLAKLISKVSQKIKVGIVISSAWREDATVEELRDQVFATCPSINQLIIGKTPHDDDKERSLDALEKYGFELRGRAAQIDYFIREYRTIWNIQAFAIFDDNDDYGRFPQLFPENFVHVLRLLSKTDTEKAYAIMTRSLSEPMKPIEAPPLVPRAIIFLDIQYVLLGDHMTQPLSGQIRDTLKKLYKTEDNHYTDFQWKVAKSRHFYSPSITLLEKLIQKVSQLMAVSIVVSSCWNEDLTVAQFRDSIFDECSFNNLIIDKTPHRHDTPHVTAAKNKYGFDLGVSGRQIDYWLRENHETWNVQRCVIFDHGNYQEVDERYPHHGIRVQNMLREAQAAEAYRILSQVNFSSEKFLSEEAVNELHRKNSRDHSYFYIPR